MGTTWQSPSCFMCQTDRQYSCFEFQALVFILEDRNGPVTGNTENIVLVTTLPVIYEKIYKATNRIYLKSSD